MPDVLARPSGGYGTYDVRAFPGRRPAVAVVAYPASGYGKYDVQARPQRLFLGSLTFPTQYAGFKIHYGGATHELCLVAVANAPTGMGGVARVRRSDGTYALYLVETSDQNATPVRIRTSAGTKAVRVKT